MNKKTILLILFLLIPSNVFGDTETLRPNAVGDETNITYQYPGSGAHWDKVDDTGGGDGVTTSVYVVDDIERDLYALPNPTVSGPISKIKVCARCCIDDTGDSGEGYIAIKIGGTVYEGTVNNLTGSYVLYSKEWATNPTTSAVWTWGNINDLQIGIKLRSDGYTDPDIGWIPGLGICTQVYVEVTYTPVAQVIFIY